MKNRIIQLVFLFICILSFNACMKPHYSTQPKLDKKESHLGAFASDREVGMFYVRNKSSYRQVKLTDGQLSEINKVLGRNVSFNVVNYKKIYRKKGGNKRGTYVGDLYKLEKNIGSSKIVVLVCIHGGKIDEIKITGDGVSIPHYLFVYFINHSFKNFSNHIAFLQKEGRLENPEETYSHYHAHMPHVTKNKYMKDMEQLKRLEEKYFILSLIEECIVANMVIS